MKKLLFNMLPIIILMLLNACTKDSITGEGPTTSVNRSLLVQNGFHTIKVNGGTGVNIIYGDAFTLEVKGYSNLVNALSTDVKNNTLVVEFPNHYHIKNDNTEIYITVPNLPNLYISGSADANLSGIFPANEAIEFSISGSGNVNAQQVNMNTKYAKYQISGSGKINTTNIVSKICETSISGSGEIKTSVVNNLKSTISGSGDIYYYGNPIVESRISGSGKVLRLQ